MNRGRTHAEVLLRVLPLLCALVGFAAIAADGSALSDRGDAGEHSSQSSGEGGDSAHGATGGGWEQEVADAKMSGSLGNVGARVRNILKGPAHKTSCSKFLSDLDKMSDSGHSEEGAAGDGGSSVYWVEEGDLPIAAEGALREYAKMDGARLETSGYLDLHGNAWAALISGRGDWCDVILATTEDGEESVVRVTRIISDGAL